mgnify:CR=1 FL=1
MLNQLAPLSSTTYDGQGGRVVILAATDNQYFPITETHPGEVVHIVVHFIVLVNVISCTV